MFGAKGDGVTDDSTALTRAINAAKTLRLPLFLARSYYSSAVINIPAQLLIEGTSIAPTAVTNLKPKTWNIKSPNGVIVNSHTTLRNVGLLETTLEITGSRNQIEMCVFSNCDRAIYLHNTTSTTWVGEEYIRNCYFYDCIEGVYNNFHLIDVDGTETRFPPIIDSEISGCTAVNDKKLQSANVPTPIQNDIFMTGYFTAMRVIDNHLYMSAVVKNCTLNNMSFLNNYFDNPFTYFDCEINGQVIIQNNFFFTSSVDPTWDGTSEHFVNKFTKATSGNKKWLSFCGNSFVSSTSAILSTIENHYTFVHTTNALVVYYHDNIHTIKDFSSDWVDGLRSLYCDYLRYSITYENQTLDVIRTTNGLNISGTFTMASNYATKTWDSSGSITIPLKGWSCRFYALLEYTDTNGQTQRVNRWVKFNHDNSNDVDRMQIEMKPTDYASGGILYINTVIPDYQLFPDRNYT